MLRQFLNIVVRHPNYYALHKLELSKKLFYEATENATTQEVAKAQGKNGGWPPSFLNFSSLDTPMFFPLSSPAISNHSNFFSLLPRQGEDCVLVADPQEPFVEVFDTDMRSAFTMRPPYFIKTANSITLSCTNQPGSRQGRCRSQQQYVISTENGSFEVFNYYKTARLSSFDNDWYWDYLPPFVPHSKYTVDPVSPPFAAAVIDSNTICASSKEGTYAFDMLSNEWFKALPWMLPFHGAAEYVPRFRCWFCLEAPKSSQHRLCAFNLTSLKQGKAPAPLYAWDYIDRLPDGWYISKRYLVNLGLGKFCIATHCTNNPPEEDFVKVKVANDELTVLTGVEVVRNDKGLQMIKHKSQHYSEENNGIHCVLSESYLLSRDRVD